MNLIRTVTNEQICSVTGHKNQTSVDKYKRQRDSEKRKISDAITESFNEEVVIVPSKISFISKENENINIDLPTGGNVTFKFDGNFNGCNFHIHTK